jgi:hypothetical protein
MPSSTLSVVSMVNSTATPVGLAVLVLLWHQTMTSTMVASKVVPSTLAIHPTSPLVVLPASTLAAHPTRCHTPL